MNARRSSRLAAVALTTGVILAACGGASVSPAPSTAAATPVATEVPSAAPTAAPSPTAVAEATEEPTGGPVAGRTGRIEIEGEQVAVTLPDGWVEVVLTGDDVEAALRNFPAGTFSEEQLGMMRAAVDAGMKLWAFDTDGSGSNLNLLVQPTELPLDLLSAGLEAQLAAIPGASGVNISKVDVGGETGLLATYDLDQAMADGQQVKMSGTQLYLSANGRLYVFTLSLADGSGVDPQDVLSTVELLD